MVWTLIVGVSVATFVAILAAISWGNRDTAGNPDVTKAQSDATVVLGDVPPRTGGTGQRREEFCEGSPSAAPSVAFLACVRDCRWDHPKTLLEPGERLSAGQHLNLLSGVAQINF